MIYFKNLKLILRYAGYFILSIIIFILFYYFIEFRSFSIFFILFISLFLLLSFFYSFHYINYYPKKDFVPCNSFSGAIRLLNFSISKARKNFRATIGRDRVEQLIKVEESIRLAKGRGVCIRIITGPIGELKEEIKEKLYSLAKENIIKLKTLNDNPVQYYGIVDNVYMYIEDMEFHKNFEIDSLFSRRYIIYRNNYYVINLYKTRFLDLLLK